MRDGVRESLIDSGVEVCGEAGDAQGAIEAARRELPDVCLLDLQMPGGGLEAARTITEELPEVAVIMLTVSDDENDLLAAVRAGALGYLLKETDPDRLAAALRGVLSGEAAVPRRLIARVLEYVRDGEERRSPLLRAPRGTRLTAREWQVMELLDRGRSTREIAQTMAVSPVTVRRHVSSAVTKLGVADREAALAVVRELGSA